MTQAHPAGCCIDPPQRQDRRNRILSRFFLRFSFYLSVSHLILSGGGSKNKGRGRKGRGRESDLQLLISDCLRISSGFFEHLWDSMGLSWIISGSFWHWFKILHGSLRDYSIFCNSFKILLEFLEICYHLIIVIIYLFFVWNYGILSRFRIVWNSCEDFEAWLKHSGFSLGDPVAISLPTSWKILSQGKRRERGGGKKGGKRRERGGVVWDSFFLSLSFFLSFSPLCDLEMTSTSSRTSSSSSQLTHLGGGFPL